MEVQVIICPKCGKPFWAPYTMKVAGKYGQTYSYLVYRHPDWRRASPRKHTVRIKAPVSESIGGVRNVKNGR